jgi:hypothetical protein
MSFGAGLIRKGKNRVRRNILQECGGAAFVLATLVVLVAVLWLRYGLLEAGVLPRDCGGSVAEGLAGLCGVKWALVQAFIDQRLGWAALGCGMLAFAAGYRPAAWAGWLCGVAGLVLYSFDPAAVGAMLALLTLGRGPCGERGQAEGKSCGEPGQRLRVGRFG